MYQAPGNPGTDPLESAERRSGPRIYDNLDVRVFGVDSGGRRFEIQVPAANLSATGLCMYLPYEVEAGEGIMSLVQFVSSDGQPRPRVAACGTVVRSRESRHRVHNRWETAVRFMEHVIV
jgi:hypothetical protein